MFGTGPGGGEVVGLVLARSENRQTPGRRGEEDRGTGDIFDMTTPNIFTDEFSSSFSFEHQT